MFNKYSKAEKESIVQTQDELLTYLDGLTNHFYSLQAQLNNLTGKENEPGLEEHMNPDRFTDLDFYRMKKVNFVHEPIDEKEINQVIIRFLKTYSEWIGQMDMELHRYIKDFDDPSSTPVPMKIFLEKTVILLNKLPETKDSLSLGVIQDGSTYFIVINAFNSSLTTIDDCVLAIKEDSRNFCDIQLGNSAVRLKATTLKRLLESIKAYLSVKGEQN